MQTIAVIGASNDHHKFGNKAVRAYLHAGWEVYPVNPREETIEGRRVYPSIAEVPVELDRITLYLPPPQTLAELPAIAAKGAREVWLNPGTADDRVVTEAARAGIPYRRGCSIVDIGLSPSQFP
jgi:uncharacterized protein